MADDKKIAKVAKDEWPKLGLNEHYQQIVIANEPMIQKMPFGKDILIDVLNFVGRFVRSHSKMLKRVETLESAGSQPTAEKAE